MQTTTTPNTVGRVAGILSGLFLFAAAVAYLLWPETMRSGATPGEFYFQLYQNAGLFQATYILFAASALCGTGLVLALMERALGQTTLVRWLSLLGLIGLSVMALNFWYEQNASTQLAKQYMYARSEYEGYGAAVFGDEDGRLWLNILPGSPLAKAGVLHGDQLHEIDGVAMEGQTPGGAMGLLLNASDSVTLMVQSPGSAPRPVTVQRGAVVFFDSSTQSAIAAIGAPKLDPNYLFGFGLVGLYLIGINWLSRGQGGFPTLLSWLGVVVGVCYWLFVLGWSLNVMTIVMAAAAAGLTLGPAWYVWTGWQLGRRLG